MEDGETRLVRRVVGDPVVLRILLGLRDLLRRRLEVDRHDRVIQRAARGLSRAERVGGGRVLGGGGGVVPGRGTMVVVVHGDPFSCAAKALGGVASSIRGRSPRVE
jgi:hypothetical protein